MKNLLGKILFWIMGIDGPSGAQDVQWQLSGSWQWNQSLLFYFCIFAILSGIYVIGIYFRERSRATAGMRIFLACIRLLLIALVVCILIFQLHIQFTRMQLPTLAVLVDRSASMSVVDEYQNTSAVQSIQAIGLSPGSTRVRRWDIVEKLLDQEILEPLQSDYNVRFFSMARSAQELNLVRPKKFKPQNPSQTVGDFVGLIDQLQPNGDSSRLGTSLQSVLSAIRGQRSVAVMILSDGITTEGIGLAGAAEAARSQAVPLYLVGIGTDQHSRELILTDLVVDEIVFINDYVDFDFKLTTYGLEGKPVELVLRDVNSGEELHRREIYGGKNGIATRYTLSDRPTQLGQQEYRIEAIAAGEKRKEFSSHLSRAIEVRDDPIKVLLVQDLPSFEFKYLKHLLERDQTIDLSVVLQQAAIEYPEQDRVALPLFPVSRDKLFQYDVIIMGDVDFEQMSRRDLENIAAFVEQKGGGLLISSGRNFNLADYVQSPLKNILPFEATIGTTFRSERGMIKPTPIGMRSPHMQLGDTSAETTLLWDRLPEIYGINAVTGIKPTARVLAETSAPEGVDSLAAPVFVVHFVPPGKVLWHATDETYRWRYRLGDALYARYWIQAIRYLSRAKLLGDKGVELTTDKMDYDANQAVQIQARFFDERLIPEADDGVEVVIEGNGQRKRVTLERNPLHRSIFEGSGGRFLVGNYEVLLSRPLLGKNPLAASFSVVAPIGEMTRTIMDQSQLRQAARRSRGKYFTVENMTEAFDALPDGVRIPVATLPPIPLWNNWRIFLVLFFLLLAEWLLRKRMGML